MWRFNMWLFLLGSVAVYNAVAWRTQKRISAPELYATVMFALFAQTLTDAFASFEYERWGFFEKNRAEFAALWIILGIYPAVTVLIVNWYPFAASWWKKILYLLAWGSYSTGYEWLSMKFDIIWHDNGWNLWWSFSIYPFLYFMLIVQLYLYRRIVKNRETQKS